MRSALLCDFGGVLTTPLLDGFLAHQEETGVSLEALGGYVELAPGGRPHIPVDRRAPVADFEQVAGRYPVFRVTA